MNSKTGPYSMRIRGRLKNIVYGVRPFYRGTFPYFGHDVYFPIGSHLFERLCREGIYEKCTLKLLSDLIADESTYVDVGANIGLMSIPILAYRPGVRVISIEASPNTLQDLEKTRDASPHRERWSIVGRAVGRIQGSATFWASEPNNAAFDGIKNTGRGGAKKPVNVRVSTLDEIWNEAGSPYVSVVKIDVEGGETDAIAGARALIERDRPAFVIEWSRLNLPAYGIKPGHLLALCREIRYRIYAHPGMLEVAEESLLCLAMLQTETFLLLPMGTRGGSSRAE